MGKYNRNFDLDLEDMELIEAALRKAAAEPDASGVSPKDANTLLGKLHNQKIFYRPRNGVYVSG